ncbi:hypothetical protein V3Q90_08640 [Flavobacterium oreochromis]|uniref:Uncharacterized protein n=1 Tax=Flavobacterium oreochromis TaxID=2906078 RepID=A0ABW8PB45_9FLAO|nr:hypothetical protein [Flavobacterium oreochromis]OWP75032.1 hypothetical protein BWG23_12215 [Flavobacterium oreochromis]
MNSQKIKKQIIKSEEMEMINKISKEKQITYTVHVNAMTPYELYLDDILIDRFYYDNVSNTIELNPYLLENGKHKLKIKYLPTVSDIFTKEGLLDPRDIYINENTRWRIYFVKLNKDPNVPLGYTNEIDYGSSELKIIAPPTKLPFWEQEWDLDIKDLPYKLKGWSESEDLYKMDKDLLEKEVLKKYNELKDLLNLGKIDDYLNLGKNKNYELDICTYTTEEQSKIDYQNNKLKMSKLCVGNMQPINDYVLKLYANGRLVTLERPRGEYKNWSALMSKTPEGRVTGWGVKLHKPKGSDHFEIIRK